MAQGRLKLVHVARSLDPQVMLRWILPVILIDPDFLEGGVPAGGLVRFARPRIGRRAPLGWVHLVRLIRRSSSLRPEWRQEAMALRGYGTLCAAQREFLALDLPRLNPFGLESIDSCRSN